LDIEENIKNKNITIESNDTIKETLRKLVEQQRKEDDPAYEIRATIDEFKTKDTKYILEKLNIPYEKDGIFGDYNKLTRLFNNAKRSDLKTFTNLIEARTNIARASKERYNNKIVANYFEDKDVYNYLSDFNSD
jgi:hypothetical protein